MPGIQDGRVGVRQHQASLEGYGRLDKLKGGSIHV